LQSIFSVSSVFLDRLWLEVKAAVKHGDGTAAEIDPCPTVFDVDDAATPGSLEADEPGFAELGTPVGGQGTVR
jgi:hypothetical protein